MNVLFCNIAWMKNYQGINSVDKPKNGGAWVEENGLAHESTNFKNYSGKHYGFVEVRGNINLQSNFKSTTKNSLYVDDVLVVWCATSEKKGNVIVGWYKHARVYRQEQSIYRMNEKLYYYIEAEAKNSVLLKEDERNFPIGRASQVGVGRGFGRSNIWYANAEIAQKEVVPKVIKYIEQFEVRNQELANGYDELSDETLHYEGSVTTVKVNKYERNQEARRKCIEIYGCQCKICGFDFEKNYGKAGKGLIQVHHVIPISSIKEEYKIDYEKDLIPVCPNCHAMIHRKKDPYSVVEIKQMLEMNDN